MKRTIDSYTGLYIDDEECQACTFWDICSRTYSACTKFRGWQTAMIVWQSPNEDDDHKDDVSGVGC